MKHHFIINPVSGKGNTADDLINNIQSIASEIGAEVSFYVTKDILDGERAAREYAQSLNGEKACIYGCGGDGTINEVINGVVGYDNVYVGFIPAGSGNDLVRNFSDVGEFTDIRAQLEGFESEMDLIEFSGIIDGKEEKRYCANMLNIGLDCKVAYKAADFKKKPYVANGSIAYLMAVGVVFIQKETINLKISSGEEVLADGEVLLCAIANGTYCGGGIAAAPNAVVDDGEFVVNIVNNISRLEFLKLFPKYKSGEHLQMKGIEKYIKVLKTKTLDLKCKDGTFMLCVDGEAVLCKDLHFEIVPKALKIRLPRK